MPETPDRVIQNPRNVQPQTDQEAVAASSRVAAQAPVPSIQNSTGNNLNSPGGLDTNGDEFRTRMAQRGDFREGAAPEIDKAKDELIDNDAYWEQHEAQQKAGMIHMIVDGKGQYVHSDKLTDAIKNGGKTTIPVEAPDGTFWHIPADRVHEAVRDGGKIKSGKPSPAKTEAKPKPKPATKLKQLYGSAATVMSQ